MKEWKPIGWAFEKGQIASGIGPYLDRRQRERRAYVARSGFPTRGEKAVRAQSIRGYIAQHGLYLPLHAPWYPTLRSEMLSFPAGRTDDQVDMLGLLGQLLDRMQTGTAASIVTKPKRDRWDKIFGESEDVVSWKVA